MSLNAFDLDSFWSSIEGRIFGEPGYEFCYRRDFRGARVYGDKNKVFKIQIISEAHNEAAFYQDLSNEYEVLEDLKNVDGVVRAVSLQTYTLARGLTTERIIGTNLASYRPSSLFQLVGIVLKMLFVTFRVSKKGIIHGDLAIHNFLIDDNKKLFLVDFGNAYKSSFMVCLGYNFFMRGGGKNGNTFPVIGAIVRCVEFYLPVTLQNAYRKIFSLKKYTSNLDL